MAVDLELSAKQCKALADIEDTSTMYVDPDEGSRRMYWIVIEQRISAAIRLGCTNQEIFNSTCVARGLKVC